MGVSRDIIAASPCAGVKPPAAERSRDRLLTDHELRNVWQAADKPLGGPFGALVKLLILTGQRRDEVAGMKWSEIDLEARLWTLPPERVKNDEKHEVPLSDALMGVMQALPRIGERFPAHLERYDTPSSGYSKGKRRLDALLPPTCRAGDYTTSAQNHRQRHGAARHQPAGHREGLKP